MSGQRERHIVEYRRKITSEKYLDWQNILTSQNLNARDLVLYNASAKDANAVFIDRHKIENEKLFDKLEFIVESKTYVFYTNDNNEAYYLAAILNSAISNLMIKDFQTKGLFGSRDIHKKILDVYFPKFDKNNVLHRQLLTQSKNAHKKAKRYLKENPPDKKLTATQLGG